MECNTRGAARLCMQAGARHDLAQRGGLAVSANEAGNASGCARMYLEGVDSIRL